MYMCICVYVYIYIYIYIYIHREIDRSINSHHYVRAIHLCCAARSPRPLEGRENKQLVSEHGAGEIAESS